MSMSYNFKFGYGFRMSLKKSSEIVSINEFNKTLQLNESADDSPVFPIFEYEDFDNGKISAELYDYLVGRYGSLSHFDYFSEYNEETKKEEFSVFLKNHYISNSVGGGAYEMKIGVSVIEPPFSVNDWDREQKEEMLDLFDWFDLHSVEPEVLSIVSVY